jgi:hypothetical protein
VTDQVQGQPTPLVVEPFDAFYLREFRGVVKLAYALSGSQLAAEDIAQEAFLRAYRDWSRISHLQRPEAWVRKVAVRLAGRVCIAAGWRLSPMGVCCATNAPRCPSSPPSMLRYGGRFVACPSAKPR